ncbi:hypothetical protein BC835DRAFT_1416806 [Cytidiella melzeri]|nr:hypothetical protein BC835DRAFT_1416806 [Cytidiella melzeri]
MVKIRREERRGNCREVVFQALHSWRIERWQQSYSKCSFPPQTLLADKYLNFIATNAHVSTLDLLQLFIPEWRFATRLGQEVLNVVARAEEQHIAQLAATASQKRQKTEANKVIQDKTRLEDSRNAHLLDLVQQNKDLPLQTTPGQTLFAMYNGSSKRFVRTDPLLVPIPQERVSQLLPALDAALIQSSSSSFLASASPSSPLNLASPSSSLVFPFSSLASPPSSLASSLSSLASPSSSLVSPSSSLASPLLSFTPYYGLLPDTNSPCLYDLPQFPLSSETPFPSTMQAPFSFQPTPPSAAQAHPQPQPSNAPRNSPVKLCWKPIKKGQL